MTEHHLGDLPKASENKPVISPHDLGTDNTTNHAGASHKNADSEVLVVTVRQATFVARYEALWEEFDELCIEMGEVPAHLLPPKTHVKTHGKTAYGKTHKFAQKQSKTTVTPTQKTANTKNNAVDTAKAVSRRQSRANQKSVDHRYPMVALYRQICQHYALARQRNYSPQLVAQLHARVMLGHRLIYRSKTGYLNRFVLFFWVIFPSSVRRHYRLFWLAFALFYVPLIVMGVACYFNDELIYTVMPSDQVGVMERMYNPENRHIGREADRASDTDLMMFGHYIANNIGIDFQVYGLGILFGIGTVFITLYNGVVIGAVAGHLTQAGFSSTFWSFVAGHGSFELTAVLISAMAGMKLATPLISPAPHSRKDAFVRAGKESVVLILGAAFMTFIAAFIEAFWSSSSVIANEVKYLVAFGLWAFVGWYLVFCGRGFVDEDDFTKIPTKSAEPKSITKAKAFHNATKSTITSTTDQGAAHATR